MHQLQHPALIRFFSGSAVRCTESQISLGITAQTVGDADIDVGANSAAEITAVLSHLDMHILKWIEGNPA